MQCVWSLRTEYIGIYDITQINVRRKFNEIMFIKESKVIDKKIKMNFFYFF